MNMYKNDYLPYVIFFLGFRGLQDANREGLISSLERNKVFFSIKNKPTLHSPLSIKGGDS
jgi:hypothetical protein